MFLHSKSKNFSFLNISRLPLILLFLICSCCLVRCNEQIQSSNALPSDSSGIGQSASTLATNEDNSEGNHKDDGGSGNRVGDESQAKMKSSEVESAFIQEVRLILIA